METKKGQHLLYMRIYMMPRMLLIIYQDLMSQEGLVLNTIIFRYLIVLYY